MPVLSVEERAVCPLPARDHLARYVAGEISAEICLMHLLLAQGDVPSLMRCLQELAAAPPRRAALAELVRVASATTWGLVRAASLVGAGLAGDSGSGGIAAIRAQFDRAVAAAPEASVALYSLGDPATLDRATAEIAARLRQWGLVGQDKAVLDIGCGIGRIERALAAEVAAITAIDVSPGMIAEARRRCHDLANVTFTCCNGRDLSATADAAIDLALAVDTFPYLAAVDPALAADHVAEAARVLRPDGNLLILNYSYRGDLAADRQDMGRLAATHGFSLKRAGTRDFALWDGASFLLRK